MTLITNKEPDLGAQYVALLLTVFWPHSAIALFSIVGGHDLSHLAAPAARLYYSTNSILTTETIIRAEAVSGRNI